MALPPRLAADADSSAEWPRGGRERARNVGRVAVWAPDASDAPPGRGARVVLAERARLRARRPGVASRVAKLHMAILTA